ncbi:MAG: bifunctional glutamate N-acetyltransferase/amino-acid acetyltransferase ArgJ [Candidatus Kryptoniota bacterium]
MNLYFDRSITFPRGFVASAVSAGIKKDKAPDLSLIYSIEPAVAAAVFTRNKFQASPIIVSRENLKKSHGKVRAIVVNSGCANALTGERGIQTARKTAAVVAKSLDIEPTEVLVASTGVIGVQLDYDKIEKAVPKLVDQLTINYDESFARGIMTTDKFPKMCAAGVELPGGRYFRIGASAKGAGMIHPNMATMLCFVTTDAVLRGEDAQVILANAVSKSFNLISVDGDTSTNDTVFLLANGASGTAVTSQSDLRKFEEALTVILHQLAEMIVKDGEGATKVIHLKIQHARSFEDAVAVGKAVAVSPLVKTAIFGGDPNWGRILSAVGNSPVNFNQRKVSLKIENVLVFNQNEPVKCNTNKLRKIFSNPEIEITIDLAAGKQSAEVITCDLSYEYVKINGEYTT